MKKFDLNFLLKKKKQNDGVEEIEFQPEANFYYAGASSRFSFAAIILITALVLFTAGALIFGSKLFTYQNFYYLVKDIDAAGDNGAEVEMISYTSSSSQSYAPYKKGVAVLGEHQLSVYTASGKKTLEAAVNYSKPVLLSSDKYILAYDLGGSSLSLYNSFANIYSIEYENQIFDAALSDNGYFAAVTTTQEYNSLIEVYNSDFQLVNQVGRSGFVTDIAFDPGGDYCCFISLNASGGELTTEFSAFKIGTEKITATAYFNGITPYCCAYLTSGRIALICDSLTYILDGSGNVINRYFYSGGKLTSYACGSEYTALVFERDAVNEKYEILIFDRDGKKIHSINANGKINGVKISDNRLFTYGSDSVTRYAPNGSDGKTVDTGLHIETVLPIDGKKVLACSSVGAKYITFE